MVSKAKHHHHHLHQQQHKPENNSSAAAATSANPTIIGASVIPIVNKLQDILSPLPSNTNNQLSNLSLPHVAVVGSQSSGKSSVLESLVGRDFLPRASDICTRRPLILQLENRPPSSSIDSDDDVVDDEREWGEFLHLPGTKFHDFSLIRTEIQFETEREAGNNKGVSEKPIRLKISSPKVLNLTLIDLPGITKVPVGDQPTDIEARIRKMVMDHIRQENCVILAVSPANSDLATSDALQMAKEADPMGSRTIGVITKLDIMDRGTNACNFLLGKVIPLQLGYIGVVNRSQADIINGKSVAEALGYEEQFFRDHPVYHCVRDQCGIPQLAKKLNQILEQHIISTFPALKSQINSYLRDVEEEMRPYGGALESKEKQGAIVLDILRSYCDVFATLIDGKNPDMSTKELTGGARINYLFQSIFMKALEEVDPCEDLVDEDVRIAIQNSMGPRNKLFVPEVAFEVLIRRQIERLLDPSLQCLRFACNELMQMSRSCEPKELQKFPVLRMRLEGVVHNFLSDAMKPAEKRIVNTIEMEADDINTSHPNFVGGRRAMELAKECLNSSKGIADAGQSLQLDEAQKCQARSSMNQEGQSHAKNDKSGSADPSSSLWGIPGKFLSCLSSSGTPVGMIARATSNLKFQKPSLIQLKEPSITLRPSEPRTDDEKIEVLVIRMLLESYFDVVRKKVEDDVSKSIMHFLVNHLKRSLHSTFIQKIYRPNLFEELLEENCEVTEKRKHASEMFHVLQQAIQTLGEFESTMARSSAAIAIKNYQNQTEQKSNNRSSSMILLKNSGAENLHYATSQQDTPTSVS